MEMQSSVAGDLCGRPLARLMHSRQLGKFTAISCPETRAKGLRYCVKHHCKSSERRKALSWYDSRNCVNVSRIPPRPLGSSGLSENSKARDLHVVRTRDYWLTASCGGLLGPLGGFWGPLGGLLGPSRGPLGAPWGPRGSPPLLPHPAPHSLVECP